ncbi:hypothetical protein [Antarctobacter heliothermus]|uniref:Polymer-forming cytoskeletal n=1 Tax=Antarctobacter heliothermus TaxID=74033 RepID=A0A239C2Q1_9RHOB|nr:hypothetical protein [Antarctobacter heliothermus]SNS14547.1 hypothetical protein SAMN04488078_100588 [Antarctobacter heliothermus]
MLKKCLVTLGLLLAAPALAQDGTEQALFGNDIYKAGATVRMSEPGRDDAFLAGQRVQLAAPVTGTAHMAGRWVDVDADLGGSLYAAGQRVRVSAPVAGDVALAGYTVSVDAAIAGDLRAFGSEVVVNGTVGESLIANGEIVELNAAVAGDAVISSRELTFGSGARIDGTLTLYEDVVGATVVPESVVGADRLTRIELKYKRVSGAFQHPAGLPKPSFGEQLSDMVYWVLVVWAIAALAALAAPVRMTDMADKIAARPLRLVGAGFVGLSVLTGGGVVVAVTMIGALLTPFFWLAAAALGAAGLFVGAYALGHWALSYVPNLPVPWIGRVAAAFLGALLAGLISLIPYLGWGALVVLTIAGAGGLVMRLRAVRRMAG